LADLVQKCQDLLATPLREIGYVVEPSLLGSCVKVASTVMNQSDNPIISKAIDCMSANIGSMNKQWLLRVFDK